MGWRKETYVTGARWRAAYFSFCRAALFASDVPGFLFQRLSFWILLPLTVHFRQILHAVCHVLRHILLNGDSSDNIKSFGVILLCLRVIFLVEIEMAQFIIGAVYTWIILFACFLPDLQYLLIESDQFSGVTLTSINSV